MVARRLPRLLFTSPLFVVPPVVIALVLGWQQYTFAGKNLNLPTDGANLMPAVTETAPPGSSDTTKWRIEQNGNNEHEVSTRRGHVTDQALMVHVSRYANGDITLVSPRVTLSDHQTYLFKSYYMSEKRFDLLMRYHYRDGSEQLIAARDYDADKDVWSTVSRSFDTGASIAAVEVVFRLAAAGNFGIDSAFLEPALAIDMPPEPPDAESGVPNRIPNALLAASDTNMPDGWSPYREGLNTANFSYLNDNRGRYVEAKVENYKKGEAKWQYDPVGVSADETYAFSAVYRGDVPANVVAEYVMRDGKREFDVLDSVPPAGSWTKVHYDLQIPDDATGVVVALVVNANGTLASRDYSLRSTTKPGPKRFERPIVSITFDDGWRSSYDNGLPTLDRFGFKSTFYVNPASIETPNFMTADKLRTLKAGGHEVAAHGYSHEDMSAISTDRLVYQLNHGQSYLAQAGYATDNFAPPYGRSDAQVTWYTRKYYKTLRGTSTGINTLQNMDPYNLKVLYIENRTRIAEIHEALRHTKRANGWLILVYHRIGSNARAVPPLKFESATILLTEYIKHIEAVSASGIAVKTIDAAYAEVERQ